MAKPFSKFGRLTRHFASGLIQNDLVTPTEDLHATIAGVLALLLVGAAGLALMLIGKYNSVSFVSDGGFHARALPNLAERVTMAVDDKALLIGGAMIVMGLLTVLAWESLSVDRRDLAILGPLPIHPATVLAAKSAAVVGAATAAAVAMNLLPSLLLPIVVLAKTPAGFAQVGTWMSSHFVAGTAACAFTFLTLSTLRGAIGLLAPPRVSRTLLPFLQFVLVLALLSLLLAAPVLASRANATLTSASSTALVFPPLWFVGLGEVLAGRHDAVFRVPAEAGLAALAIVLAAALGVHLVGFLRRSRQLNAADSVDGQKPGRGSMLLERLAQRLVEDRRARASFLFTARTLARSPRHRLHVAAALGLGLAVSGATVAAAFGGWKVGREAFDLTTMALAAQLNLVFFLVIGVRLSATIPADLDAAWVFRFHATPAHERHLAGTRSAIFVLMIVPLLLALAPVHALLWGAYTAVVHLAFGIVLALILLEIAFKDYDRLPFAAAFVPGRTVLSLRLPLYVLDYVLLVYVTPQIEQLLIERTGMFYAWVGLFLLVFGRFVKAQSSRVRRDRLSVFDGREEEVVQLRLTDGPGAPLPAAVEGGSAGSSGSGLLFSRFGSALPPSEFGRAQGAGRVRAFRAGAVRSLDVIRNDGVLALKRLRRNPGYALFAIVSLSVAIAVTAGIYSVIYSSILRPLAVPEIDRLVNVYHTDPYSGGSRWNIGLSEPDFRDLAARQTVFSSVAAHAPFRQVAIVGGAAERVVGEAVTGNYFPTLGVPAALGRTLHPDDDLPGAAPVVVIADRLWRQRFSADPSVVGRTLSMGGQKFEIVGVAPSSFRGVELPNLAPTSVWVTVASAHLVGVRSAEDDREDRWLVAKARLARGRTVEEASAAVALLGRQLDSEVPIGRDLPWELRSPPAVARHWKALAAADRLVTEQADAKVRQMARVTMLSVCLVLLVACTNLANLTLARGTARRRDFAVRWALGASRWSLVREHVVESAIVALLGGLLGVAGIRLLSVYGIQTSIRAGAWVDITVAPVLDGGSFAAALVAVLLALVVFGLVPALKLTSAAALPKAGGLTAEGEVRWRAGRLLIATQVAVSVALVAVAGVSVRQVAVDAGRDAGFDLHRLAVVGFDFQSQRWSEERARRALESVANEAKRSPGIGAVTIATGLPVGATGWASGPLSTPDRPFDAGQRGEDVTTIVATPSVFATFGVRLANGRLLDERDDSVATPVIVIGELVARRLFGTTDVIGRQVLRRVAPTEYRLGSVETRTIVGVVRDTDSVHLGQRTRGVAYVPFAQHYEPHAYVVARTPGNPGMAVTALQGAARRVQPELGIVDAGTGAALGGVENITFEVMAAIAGGLGIFALVLAMVGLYGVLSFVVARRTHEMGIRVALGANARQIIRPIVLDGFRPVIEGLVIGFVIGDLATMATRPAFSTPVPALDAMTLMVVPLPFLAAAWLACYLPARRAARVAPDITLREL
jgi:predicted permease